MRPSNNSKSVGGSGRRDGKGEEGWEGEEDNRLYILFMDEILILYHRSKGAIYGSTGNSSASTKPDGGHNTTSVNFSKKVGKPDRTAQTDM